MTTPEMVVVNGIRYRSEDAPKDAPQTGTDAPAKARKSATNKARKSASNKAATTADEDAQTDESEV